MVGVEEFVVYFLIIPVVANVVGAAWLRLALRRTAKTNTGLLREPSVKRRYFTYLLIFLTTIAFGAVLLLRSLDAMQRADSFFFPSIVRAIGRAFAGTVVVTTLSEAWIVVRRRPGAYRADFGPSIMLAIIPHSAILFSVVFGLEAIARYSAGPLMPVLDGPYIGSFLVLLGSAGAPVIAVLTNAVPALDLPSLRRALRRSWMGSALILGCFAAALFFISR